MVSIEKECSDSLPKQFLCAPQQHDQSNQMASFRWKGVLADFRACEQAEGTFGLSEQGPHQGEVLGYPWEVPWTMTPKDWSEHHYYFQNADVAMCS